MAARYQLRPVGVFDTDDSIAIVPSDIDRWYAYQAWLRAGNVPDPAEAAVLPRADVIANLWARIKERRQRCKDGGVAVWVAGTKYWFHTDADSRIQWLDLLADVRDGTLAAGVLWKSMSGAFVGLADQIVLDYRAALKAKELAAFSRAEVLRAEINNAADPAAVDLSGGWPENYDDPLPIPEIPG